MQDATTCTAITLQRRLRVPKAFAEALETYLRAGPYPLHLT